MAQPPHDQKPPPASAGELQVHLKHFLAQPAVQKRLLEVTNNAMQNGDLVRLTLMAASRSQRLLEVTTTEAGKWSFVRALMDAAALGIRPGGLLGRGFLVPRWNKHTKAQECHFDPGWRGLLDIAYRHGILKRAEAHVVYAADRYVIIRNPFTSVDHEPADLDEADLGGIVGAYACFEWMNGGVVTEVLRKRDLDMIRESAEAKGGPWENWMGEMARKSAVKRGLKYAPYNEVLERAIVVATSAETGEREDEPEPASIPLAAGALMQKASREAKAQERTKALAERVGQSAREQLEGQAEAVPVTASGAS